MRLALKLGAVLLAGVVLGAIVDVEARGFGRRGGGGGYIPPPTITSVAFSTPFRYLDNYSAGYYTQGDSWYSAWGDNGTTYLMCNDCTPPQTAWANNQNMLLNTLSNTNAASVANGGPIVAIVSPNGLLTPWGHYSDQTPTDGNMSHKSAGLLCLPGTPNGVLYILNRRYENAAPYYFQNGQLLKSTDYGQSWNPQPPTTGTPSTNQPYASPMFPGNYTPAGFFQYGQCYAGSGPDGSGTGTGKYIYTGVFEGGVACCQQREWLARVLASAIGGQVASDWQYYTGTPANDDGLAAGSWTGTFSTTTATPILTPSALGTTAYNCCGSDFVYLPRYQQYLYLGGAGKIINAYFAPRPWGPYRLVQQYTTTAAGALSWVNPIVSSLQNGGQTLTFAWSGDPGTAGDPSLSTNTYTLFLQTMTISP